MNRSTLKTYSRRRVSKPETIDEDDVPESLEEKKMRKNIPRTPKSKTTGSKSPRSKSEKQKEESSTPPSDEKFEERRSLRRRVKSGSSSRQPDEKSKKENTPQRNTEKVKKVNTLVESEKRKQKDSHASVEKEDTPNAKKDKVVSSPILEDDEKEEEIASKLPPENQKEEKESLDKSEERVNDTATQATPTKKKGKYRPKPASKQSKGIRRSEPAKETNDENEKDEIVPPTLTTESLIKVLEDDSEEDNIAGTSTSRKKSTSIDGENLKNSEPFKDVFVKLTRVDNYMKDMIDKRSDTNAKLNKENNEIEKKKVELEKKNKIESDVKELEKKRGRPRKTKNDDPSVQIILPENQVSTTPTFSMQTRKRKLKFRLDGSLVKSDDENQRLPSDSEESYSSTEEIEKAQKSSNKYKPKSKQVRFDKSNFDFATYYKDRASGKFKLNEESNVEQKKYRSERSTIEPALQLLSAYIDGPITLADVMHESYKANVESEIKLPKINKKADIRPRGPKVEANFSPYIYENSHDYIMLSCAEELFEKKLREEDDSEKESSDDDDDNVSPSPAYDGAASLENSTLQGVKEIISKSIKAMEGWNVTMVKGSSALFIGLIAIGRMGMPILKKSVQIDEHFSAKVFIHQLHCKRYDGIYNTIDSILALIKEVDSLVA